MRMCDRGRIDEVTARTTRIALAADRNRLYLREEF
jgi:hypothetical protein